MRETLEATLAKLISIPSVSTNREACHEIIEFVRSEIETFGLFMHSETDTANPWLIATTQDTKEPDILLVAHLDVIPAPDTLFAMKKRDGKLYGRGTFDMKFAAACYLEFAKKHADVLSTLNIGFLFTTDEEIGSPGMPDIMQAGWRPKVAFIPDGGDNWEVEQRAKGIYGLRLTAHGKTAHGSRPWEGKSAIHTLMDVLAILRAEYPSETRSNATLMVNKIQGGEAINQIADLATAEIDFRCFDRQEIKTYQHYISELAKAHGLDVTLMNAGDPLIFNKEVPSVQDFLRIMAEERGTEVTFCDSYGATDGRFFAPYDIPCIIVELRGAGRHSPEEWIVAEDLPKYYRLLERWLLLDKQNA